MLHAFLGLARVFEFMTMENINDQEGKGMKLKDYFEKTKGRGIIATSDMEGKVGIAVYARPHFINEKTVAFIMADRLIHKHLEYNPHAAYLFMESGEKYGGKRLYLTKVKEEKSRMLVSKEPIPREWWPDLSKPENERYIALFPGSVQ